MGFETAMLEANWGVEGASDDNYLVEVTGTDRKLAYYHFSSENMSLLWKIYNEPGESYFSGVQAVLSGAKTRVTKVRYE